MAASLTCTNLGTRYVSREIVRNFSAQFPAGQLSCILGPNGAGKTTLLRAIAGYLPLASGSVRIGDVDAASLTPRQRARQIATVPQASLEQASLTVRDVLELARYPHRLGRDGNGSHSAAVERALADCGLTELTERRCTTLSGGELRRVLIAQGLAQETPVLLLDEPTAFLDPPARVQLLRLLQGQARLRELAVVAVLHDPALARRFADFAVLLRDGVSLAQGAARDVLTESALAELYGCPAADLADVL
jgi:ABC-type cobalamin/Fe3+-siderophores transport system ATPase subunit